MKILLYLPINKLMLRRLVTILIIFTVFFCCNNTYAAPETVRSIFDVLIPKKELPLSRMGVNSFANDPGFGTVKAQLSEVRNTLGLKYNRVLFAWNDQVQKTPNSKINFSFYDDIAKSLPRGSDMLIVVTGLPSWMRISANWINGNPRETFTRSWLEPLLRRYGNQSKVIGVQVWNEPNMLSDKNNQLMGFSDPKNYLQLLSFADASIHNIAPSKKLVMAATTAINQNFPDSLNYNKALLEGGAGNYADIWAIHYYGNDIFNVLRPGGVKDFAKNIPIPVWLTESGERGTTKQLEYTKRYWPFLKENIPQISRFYFYQFTERGDPKKSYGLKNGRSVSDLYLYLRSKKKR